MITDWIVLKLGVLGDVDVEVSYYAWGEEKASIDGPGTDAGREIESIKIDGNDVGFLFEGEKEKIIWKTIDSYYDEN